MYSEFLQVGGRLGQVFDEDPKRWRMLSEALATLGMSLEIATAFAPPQAFLLLAGAHLLLLLQSLRCLPSALPDCEVVRCARINNMLFKSHPHICRACTTFRYWDSVLLDLSATLRLRVLRRWQLGAGRGQGHGQARLPHHPDALCRRQQRGRRRRQGGGAFCCQTLPDVTAGTARPPPDWPVNRQSAGCRSLLQPEPESSVASVAAVRLPPRSA